MVIAIIILAILGLAWGSFVNALVWRFHEQAEISKARRRAAKHSGAAGAKARATSAKELSILNGRSMCPSCRHTLSASDLIPVVSWLVLGGKCRYCKQPISPQYPLVEALVALVFVVSYLFWPLTLASVASFIIFGLWLAAVVVLVALAVYDLRWQLLPNRLVLMLAILALAQAVVIITTANSPVSSLVEHIIAAAIGGGIFYIILVISRGKWIGGGDVKLGFVLGLLAGSWGASILLLFLAAVAGTLASLPLLATKKLGRKSVIPFGPFLILATIIVVIWGSPVINWYLNLITLG